MRCPLGNTRVTGIRMHTVDANDESVRQKMRILARRLLFVGLHQEYAVCREHLVTMDGLPQQRTQIDAPAHILESQVNPLLIDLQAFDAHAVSQRAADVPQRSGARRRCARALD